MDRRRFVTGVGGMVAAGMCRAQPAKRWRVGWISTDQTLGSAFFEAFRGGLRDLGYEEGRNLEIDARWGEDKVEALVRSNPDVIVTQGGLTHAVVRAAPTSPLVFGYSGDPVEAGFANSLARPGKNYTGMSFLSHELVGKRLELLKEIMPALKRVAILANPHHPGDKQELRASELAAAKLGLDLDYVPVREIAHIDQALAAVSASRSEAMDVFPDVITMRLRERIAHYSVQRRIPAISGWARFAEGGNVLSYGPNLRVVYRELAGYVHQVLQGNSPANMPIRLPNTIELVINMKTAKALGLKVPQSVLFRADQVIE
jgi:putative tryptophan/tyrosine transport system substrate-binding protein